MIRSITTPHRLVLTVVILSVLAASAAHADPVDLARVMPDGTLIYLARSGDDQTDAAIRDTAFGRLLADRQMRSFLDGIWGAVDAFAREQAAAGEDAESYSAAKRILQTLSRRPVALALIDGGFGEVGPFVEAALVVHLGDAKAAFLADVERIIESADLPPAETVTIAGASLQRLDILPGAALFHGAVKDYFILAVGQSAVEKIAARINGGKQSLADSRRLELPRRRIGGDDSSRAYTLYLDLGRLIKRAQALLPMITQGDQESTNFFVALLDGLGRARLQSFCWEQHYGEQGCRSSTYIHTAGDEPSPFAELTGKPLTDDDLAMIPKSPAWAFAANIDLAAIYRHLIDLVKSFDADMHGDMTAAIEDAEDHLDLEFDRDLLALIGDTIVMYDAPENGGFLITGVTGIVESADPKRLRRSLRKIVRAISDAAGEGVVSVQTREYRGHTIEFVNVVGVPMPIAPAWAAHDNRLVFGLYPQMVKNALDGIADGKPETDSLLANADFVRARKVLGPLGSSITYVDTKASMGQAYPWLLLLGQMGAAMAQGEGIALDMSTFPTQRALTRHLFATVGTTRSDPDGMLYASFGPLPIGGQSFIPSDIGTVAMLTSILLPSLSRARELSKRTVCSANLRGIGQAMYIHAQDDDKFPPDFQTLLDDNNTTERQFLCPSTVAKVGDLTACYEYIKGQTTSSEPINVLMYEKEQNHGEGGNVLFQDGHVSFIRPYSRVEELVKETKERLAKKKKKEN